MQFDLTLGTEGVMDVPDIVSAHDRFTASRGTVPMSTSDSVGELAGQYGRASAHEAAEPSATFTPGQLRAQARAARA
jgi:hypothetical protein